MDITVNERLRKFVEKEELAFTQFSKIVHASSVQQVSNWMTCRENIPEKYIKATLLAFPRLNARWLLIGDGYMYGDALSFESAPDLIHINETEYCASLAHLIRVIDEIDRLADDVRFTIRTLRISMAEAKPNLKSRQ